MIISRLIGAEITEERNNQLTKNATYFALCVSIVLSTVKFANYFLTGSLAIQASALDSLSDIAVSFANFVAIKLMQRKSSSLFPNGYDKIAAVVALCQIILVAFLASFLLHECFEKLTNPTPVEEFGYGVLVITLALILTTALVLYQRMVVKKTGSIVIKADMIHYKTDFFTNFAILAGLFCMWAFDVCWLDPLIGILSAIYLLSAVVSLLKTSVASLLDMGSPKLAENISAILKDHKINIKSQDIAIFFTGTKNKIRIKVHKEDVEMVQQIRNVLIKQFHNALVEVVLV